MTKRLKFATITFITIMLFSPAILSAAQHPGGGEPSSETGELSYDGNTNVGSTWEKSLNLAEELMSQQEGIELEEIMVIDIVFILKWTDDQGSDSDPDTFSISTGDGNRQPESNSGDEGDIIIAWEEIQEGPPYNGTWNVEITCENAGSTPLIRPGGILTESDPGNSWELMISFSYVDVDGMGGGPPPEVQALLDSPIFKAHIALMVASVFLFLGAGFISFAYLSRDMWLKGVLDSASIKKFVVNPRPLIFIIILTWIIFFIAAVPLGMYVAGEYYGWHKAWTGFPAMWNPEAWEMTNADNVSFVALALWALPMYINRAWVLKGKRFAKLFGRFSFAMKRAAKAPPPKLSYREFTLSYFFLGILIFVIFEVQPHGGG